MKVLPPGAVDYLKSLHIDENAERKICMIPLGGIYWSDEIPDFKIFLRQPDEVRRSILRLFSIRFRIWEGEILDAGDQAYWATARSEAPNYPLFHRVQLSEDDLALQHKVEQEAIDGFEALLADADDVLIREDGSFSITYDLTNE